MTYFTSAQAYALISSPTAISIMIGVFHFIAISLCQGSCRPQGRITAGWCQPTASPRGALRLCNPVRFAAFLGAPPHRIPAGVYLGRRVLRPECTQAGV